MGVYRADVASQSFCLDTVLNDAIFFSPLIKECDIAQHSHYCWPALLDQRKKRHPEIQFQMSGGHIQAQWCSSLIFSWLKTGLFDDLQPNIKFLFWNFLNFLMATLWKQCTVTKIFWSNSKILIVFFSQQNRLNTRYFLLNEGIDFCLCLVPSKNSLKRQPR